VGNEGVGGGKMKRRGGIERREEKRKLQMETTFKEELVPKSGQKTKEKRATADRCLEWDKGGEKNERDRKKKTAGFKKLRTK